jgi:hypothetical protein
MSSNTVTKDKELDDWPVVGTRLGCVLGAVLALPALAYHIATLRWLRAPRWKNKAEARAELARLVRDHEACDYEFWAARVGRTKRVEFTTAAGTWYQGAVEPIWDDKPNGAIRVFFSLDDGGVGAFHPMTDSVILDKPPASSKSKESAGR